MFNSGPNIEYLYYGKQLLTTKPLPKLFWRSPHDRGRESLLVLRGKTQFRTSVAKNLFFSSFRHYVRPNIFLLCILVESIPVERILMVVYRSSNA